MEYGEAVKTAQRDRHLKSTFKSRGIVAGQAELEGSIQKADARVKERHSKYEGSLSKFANANIWPIAVSQDSLLEDITRQFQDLQKQFGELAEKLKTEDSFQGNSITPEQLLARQTSLNERLDQIELHQEDVENSIEQRLNDFNQRHENFFNEMVSKAKAEEEQMVSDAELFKEQVDQVAKGCEPFAEEVVQVHTRQADALHRIQKLEEENEQLKKRLDDVSSQFSSSLKLKSIQLMHMHIV